ncbi:MurR/RpiR family transcriptional regulator [Halieaceae bacterium IMCC14734]|uniref:MurR/RpiR family transcriptional regulator n=1 Tax=Candidatus Litorirhabdus singularis TaxID=2518993 RepID=A0ABT3TKV0_9GAMM|nr:MurR/RpiR family transcriptional regulator [Candidatus Litorirhabdus singularis]MCX2982944.1 MurR/RpiR family transcriptional regulator [Candidatus Litorirhabdus singularis]
MKTPHYTFPPESFAALRQLPVLIGRGDVDLPMGKQSYRALCQMMDTPEIVAMGNISTLAVDLGVSAPTLSRLAKLLGFAGFPEFQVLFRNHLIEPDRFYSSQVERLVQGKKMVALDLLQELAEESGNNITRALEQVAPADLQQIVEWMATSPRVFLFGYRQSAALATLMSYGLNMIRAQVQQLGAQGQGLSLGLSQLRKSDLIILFSSSPYSRETVLAGRLAREQQARVVAITDSHLSPLSQWADLSLMLPTESQFYSNSFGATVFMMEALMTLVARVLGPKAVTSLESREHMISALNDQY